MNPGRAIVIGAGIVGLATARALAERGYSVTVLERSDPAVGASVRNFGMVLPFAQPDGLLYDRAMRSRAIWCDIAESGAFEADECGSLYVAQHTEEFTVLEELTHYYGASRKVRLLSTEDAAGCSHAINRKNVKGALFSPDEVIIDPRQAIACLPPFLTERYGVTFKFGRSVQRVSANKVIAGDEQFEPDIVFVCSGIDFETLYPSIFDSIPITRCKLQMLRTEPQPTGWRMGPALCGGLSLLHYESFRVANSLEQLRTFFDQHRKQYLEEGIHVMMTQHASGELTIGDSHQYGQTPDPFDYSFINKLILIYLQEFASIPNPEIKSTWHGLYSKMTNGDSEVFVSPEPGVYILNGLGGAGMTLSFGLAEEVVAKL